MVGIKRKASSSTSCLPLVTPSTAMPPLVALAYNPALMSRPMSSGMTALSNYQRSTIHLGPASAKRVKLDHDPSSVATPPLVALAYSSALMSRPMSNSPGMPALSNYKRSANVLLSPSSTKRMKLSSSFDWSFGCPATISSIPIEPVLPVQIVELSEEDSTKRFTQTKPLAEGGYGETIKALDSQTKRSVIVKSFLRKDILNWTDGIPTEIDILRSLNHKNIAPMLDAFVSNLNYRITMPDTHGMDLTEYPVPINIDELVPSFRFVVREIAQGLRYLQEDCMVVHLDIKPGNIIIWKKGEEFQVQIIDFGCAKRYSKGEKKFVVNNGTELYACKELYTRTRIVGPEADIFSLGVFLHVVIFNEYPFETIEEIKSKDEVKLPEIMNAPENYAIRELIKNTLVKRPSSRWTINQVLSSDWLQQNDDFNCCWFP